jgi:uncharacterized protein YbjT (DUF2867 family)
MGMNCGYPTIDTPASDPKTGCMTNEPILVLGATGKTGRRVVERLQARGVEVRAGSRSSQPPFHWEDGALAEQAQRSGVQRVVLLSGRGEEEAQRSERVVAAAGIDWTVVRCSWFNQNFSEGYMLDPILGGELALPAGDVPEPFVDAQDIADVAVAALTGDGHTGEIYELTGPRLLTFAEAVAEIGRATGRELRYVQVSMDEYAAAAAEQDIPDDVAWLIRYLFSEVLDGRNANLADGVQRALGREPRDFADFAREAAAAAVWDV